MVQIWCSSWCAFISHRKCEIYHVICVWKWRANGLSQKNIYMKLKLKLKKINGAKRARRLVVREREKKSRRKLHRAELTRARSMPKRIACSFRWNWKYAILMTLCVCLCSTSSILNYVLRKCARFALASIMILSAYICARARVAFRFHFVALHVDVGHILITDSSQIMCGIAYAYCTSDGKKALV